MFGSHTKVVLKGKPQKRVVVNRKDRFVLALGRSVWELVKDRENRVVELGMVEGKGVGRYLKVHNPEDRFVDCK